MWNNAKLSVFLKGWSLNYECLAKLLITVLANLIEQTEKDLAKKKQNKQLIRML